MSTQTPTRTSLWITITILLCLSQLTLCQTECSTGYRTTDVNGTPSCQPCSKCRPGTRVSRECNEYHDTQCQVCEEGTYSHNWSRSRVCRYCTNCPPHLNTVRKCTKTNNAKCAKNCDHGYFRNELTDECDKCSSCTSKDRHYKPPRVPECRRQGMPPDLQCVPTRQQRSSYDFLGNNYADDVKPPLGEIGPVTRESTRSTTTEQTIEEYHLPSHHYFTIPTIVASVIVICVAMGIAIYCIVSKRRMQNSGDYISLNDSSPNEDRELNEGSLTQPRERGFLNPMEELEQKGLHNYQTLDRDEDVLWDAYPSSTAREHGTEHEDNVTKS
ncbi:uncharacterized protein LOC144438809 [Glandiceps talaboti]